MLDLDHFKRFNDTFGHDAGDLALRECARVLSQNLRKSDIACRLGGEEFALVFPDSSLADTRQRVEQICALIKQLEIRHDGQLARHDDPVGRHRGVARARFHRRANCLRAADAALYAAKQAGREQVVMYELTDVAKLNQRTAARRPFRRSRGRGEIARTTPAATG